MADHGPAAQEDTGEIDVDDTEPVAVTLLPDRSGFAADTGIVDEDIDAARLGQNMLDH